jgi:hypothetical protein
MTRSEAAPGEAGKPCASALAPCLGASIGTGNCFGTTGRMGVSALPLAIRPTYHFYRRADHGLRVHLGATCLESAAFILLFPSTLRGGWLYGDFNVSPSLATAYLEDDAASDSHVMKEPTRNYGRSSWCPGRGSNPYSLRPRDFKSLVSTNFTTRAAGRL